MCLSMAPGNGTDHLQTASEKMRRIRLLLPLLLLLTACQTSTTPERREILGSWSSRDFAGGTITMTLTETARAVAGAGSWTTPTEAFAFEAIGALAEDEVSLLFRFAERADINFQGHFDDDDVLDGELTGDGLRGVPVIFDRVDLNP